MIHPFARLSGNLFMAAGMIAITCREIAEGAVWGHSAFFAALFSINAFMIWRKRQGATA